MARPPCCTKRQLTLKRINTAKAKKAAAAGVGIKKAAAKKASPKKSPRKKSAPCRACG